MPPIIARRPRQRLAACLGGLAVVAAACQGPASTTALARTTVAFVMVGGLDDLGYNQAVYEGTLEVARQFPDAAIIRVEHVPETDEAARVMRELITDEGADLIFATSFGHLPFAYQIAKDFPEVVVVHQGGTEPNPPLDNFGTYFGSHWEAMFEAGVAAGAATQSGTLGFIAAFPIPATYANINAFTLGARRVRPDITTDVVFTEDWCNPDLQRTLAQDLIDGGADVLALHQDCTRAVLEVAETAGVRVVGYHADGSEVAVTQWLVGAVWNWGPLYSDIVRTVSVGRFDDSPYTRNYRGSIVDSNNPFILTAPGPSVTPATVARMAVVRQGLLQGETPFTGPLSDNTGMERLPPGVALAVEDVDQLDWFVSGVEVR